MDTQEFLAHFGDKHYFVALSKEKPPESLHSTYKLAQATLQLWNNQGYDIYFTVNEVDGKARREENVIKARALWLDDDGGKHGNTDPAKFPIPPSITVETSPGKHHYYWLTETTNFEDWSKTIQGIAKEYNGDPAVTDLPRILRVPGFINHKYDNKPVVKVVNGSKKRIKWAETNAFPQSETVIRYNSTGTPQAEFSVKQCITDILTGDTVHDSRIRLALHWANSGLPKDDALAILNAHVEDAIRSGTVDNGRAMERLANMKQCVDGAYKKVDEEQAVPLIYHKEENHRDIYTRLPEPIGALANLTQSVYKYMPYPSKEMALVVAQHTISTFGGGLFRLGKQTLTRKRTILAPTGRGKSIAGNYFNEVLRRIAVGGSMVNPYLFAGSDSFSKVSGIHGDLYNHRVRSYIRSEAGLYGKSNAGTISEDQAYLLDILTANYKSMVQAKQYSNRTIDNKKANEKLKPLYGVVAIMLAESVPDSYAELLNSTDAYRSGNIGREEIVFVDPHRRAYNIDCETDIDDDIINNFTFLAKEFEDKNAVEGYDPSNPDKFIAIDTTAINQAIGDMYEHYNDLYNSSETETERGMYPRMAERILTTVLVQATADAAANSCLQPVATMDHFDWAMAYQEELLRSLVAQTHSGSLSDPFDLCIERMIDHATTFGSHAYDRIQPGFATNIVTQSWITSVLDKGKFKPVRQCLQTEFRDRRTFNRAIIEHCENINLLIPLATGSKVSKWRINTSIKKNQLKG